MKKCTLSILMCFLLISSAFSQYSNVKLGEQNVPNEPSIAFSMKNPSVMVAGANMASVYYSSDAGSGWTAGSLSSSLGVWGDPCIISDTNGTFYYFHLNINSSSPWYDRIVCQRSTDDGHTWTDGTSFGSNGTKTQEKEWAVCDPLTNNLYVTWTQSDADGSSNPLDSSNIHFSRSVDGGLSWSNPARVNQVAGHCIADGYGVQGSAPTVGPNGEIYVTWASPLGIMFSKSTNQGNSWPSGNVTVASLPVGWGCLVPGVERATGLPAIACDRSQGQNRGNIYINWSDQRNGSSDADIWFSKSTDGGITWSDMKRVNNDPPGKQNFFSWMTVDQVTGYIYFDFYDRRNYSDQNTDVYMAVSKDGGASFYNFKVSQSPFIPNASLFLGDYNSIYAHNNVIRPIWTRMSNDSLSIWTATVNGLTLGVGEEVSAEPSALLQNYPNPIRSFTNFAYEVYQPSFVSLRIYDMLGKEVAVIFTNKFHQPGQYIERVSADKMKLAPGVYFYALIYRDKVEKRKMVMD